MAIGPLVVAAGVWTPEDHAAHDEADATPDEAAGVLLRVVAEAEELPSAQALQEEDTLAVLEAPDPVEQLVVAGIV